MIKEMKKYKVFLLFLIMSMSVFADDQKVKEIDLSEYPQITITFDKEIESTNFNLTEIKEDGSENSITDINIDSKTITYNSESDSKKVTFELYGTTYTIGYSSDGESKANITTIAPDKTEYSYEIEYKFSKVKVKEIDLSEYPQITLTFDEEIESTDFNLTEIKEDESENSITDINIDSKTITYNSESDSKKVTFELYGTTYTIGYSSNGESKANITTIALDQTEYSYEIEYKFSEVKVKEIDLSEYPQITLTFDKEIESTDFNLTEIKEDESEISITDINIDSKTITYNSESDSKEVTFELYGITYTIGYSSYTDEVDITTIALDGTGESYYIDYVEQSGGTSGSASTSDSTTIELPEDLELEITEGEGGGNAIESGSVEDLNYGSLDQTDSYSRSIEIKLESANNNTSKEIKASDLDLDVVETIIREDQTLDGLINSYEIQKIDDYTFTVTYDSGTQIQSGDIVQLTIVITNGNGVGEGNSDTVTVSYTVPNSPKDIDKIETYEEANDDWGDGEETTVKIKDEDDNEETYIFTKGGATSYVTDPAIYVTIPKYKDDYKDGEEIKKLKIETLKESGSVDTSVDSKSIEVSQNKDYEEIVTVTSNFVEGVNRIRVTPVNKYGVEGNSEDFYFVSDTQVNDTYLEDEIIGELTSTEELKEEYSLMTGDEKKRYSMKEDDIENLTSDKIIIVNLDELKELSGIVEYSYKFEVGDEEKSGADDDINVSSSISLSTGSTDKIVVIDPSDFVEGSKATLFFTVYDKLGNEKTFEKTYFIPKYDAKITAQIEDEVKYRNSKLKIVTEGNEDSFGLKSNLLGSSEQE